MSKLSVLRPRISEKAYAQSEVNNVYIFEVPLSANRNQVAAAVAEQFDVTVENVNILNVKGKTKTSYRRGGRPTVGKRSDIKKAYVTLKEGDSIAIFASEDEQEKPKKGSK